MWPKLCKFEYWFGIVRLQIVVVGVKPLLYQSCCFLTEVRIHCNLLNCDVYREVVIASLHRYTTLQDLNVC